MVRGPIHGFINGFVHSLVCGLIWRHTILDPFLVVLILACCISGLIEGLMIEDIKSSSPWKHQNYHAIKPTMEVMKKEIKRRDAEARGISNLKFDRIVQVMKDKNELLTVTCKEFIVKEFKRFKCIFENVAA